MPINPRHLKPSELCRVLNSTSLGEVVSERQLYRDRQSAGFRIGDGKHVDLFRYVAWAVREVLIPDVKSPDGHQILLASGYNKPKTEPRPDESHLCSFRQIWTPWGWAVDQKRLLWLIAHWCGRNKKCFTCQFRAKYRRTRREVFPLLSRIQNIGYEMGENNRSRKSDVSFVRRFHNPLINLFVCKSVAAHRDHRSCQRRWTQ